MNIETLLHQKIESELTGLDGLDPESEAYKIKVDGLTKLMDRAIEIDKLNIEQETKTKQMKEDKIDHIVKDVIAVLGIVLPLIAAVWGTRKSIEFEKEGTFTTIAGRGFVNRILRIK